MQAIVINNDIDTKESKMDLSKALALTLIPKGKVNTFEIFGEVVKPSILYGGFITKELSIDLSV